ncbi:MAG: selenobiotic family radical SAM modification target peptide [Candidatus Schekmanbacteria bacterium]|nr:selenobiotic family radical SAM modification target peptide [Candidatus Schekmanbacteria bacterium]
MDAKKLKKTLANIGLAGLIAGFGTGINGCSTSTTATTGDTAKGVTEEKPAPKQGHSSHENSGKNAGAMPCSAGTSCS